MGVGVNSIVLPVSTFAGFKFLWEVTDLKAFPYISEFCSNLKLTSIQLHSASIFKQQLALSLSLSLSLVCAMGVLQVVAAIILIAYGSEQESYSIGRVGCVALRTVFEDTVALIKTLC